MVSTPAEFTPPVQERSEETLRRIVDAARDALDTTSYDRLTLAELTARAGVTTGAFYQRFPSKAAFLKYLEQEDLRRISEASAVLFASPPTGPGRPVRQQVRAFVRGMALLYQEHRGVLRELERRSRSSDARRQRRGDLTREIVGRAVDRILAHGGPIGHPEPRKALATALLFTSSALRDVILFDETWESADARAAVDSLVEELVRAAEAYLELPAP